MFLFFQETNSPLRSRFFTLESYKQVSFQLSYFENAKSESERLCISSIIYAQCYPIGKCSNLDSLTSQLFQKIFPMELCLVNKDKLRIKFRCSSQSYYIKVIELYHFQTRKGSSRIMYYNIIIKKSGIYKLTQLIS